MFQFTLTIEDGIMGLCPSCSKILIPALKNTKEKG